MKSHELEPDLLGNNKEQLQQPFSVEKADLERITTVDIEDRKLVVNGEEFGGFGSVLDGQTQKNGIFSFSVEKNAKRASKDFIDPENLNKSFPSVEIENHLKNNQKISVAGFVWNSLNEKKVFIDKNFVTVDPLSDTIVMRTEGKNSGDDSCEVIVNNLSWKNKFDQILSAESYNGQVLAVARKYRKEPSLFVNDKEWIWTKSKDESKRERIEDARTNGNGVVVGILGSGVTEKGVYSTLVGDYVGVKKEWKTKFDYSREDENKPRVIVDGDSDTVAVFGIIDEIPTLVVNDIICKLPAVPQKIEKFRIEDGVVFIQYVDAGGRKHAEKVSLNERAHEVQNHNNEQERINEELIILRKLLADASITTTHLMKAFAERDNLKNELEKEKKTSGKYWDLQNKFNVLKAENDYVKRQLASQERETEKIKQELKEANETIEDLKDIFETYSKKDSGVFAAKPKIHIDLHPKFKLIFNKGKKENNKPTEKQQQEKNDESGLFKMN